MGQHGRTGAPFDLPLAELASFPNRDDAHAKARPIRTIRAQGRGEAFERRAPPRMTALNERAPQEGVLPGREITGLRAACSARRCLSAHNAGAEASRHLMLSRLHTA